MNRNQTEAELRQITLFKDSVLSAADAKRVEIIADAQRESDEALAAARKMCELADHDVIENRLAMDTQRQISAATQVARRELLAVRQTLVESLFAEVEAQLLAFATTPAYGSWLAKKLAAHRGAFAEGAPLTVYVRPADMTHAKALQQALPACAVQPDETILLGGLKAADGQVQFDDTMDLALATEKEAFYSQSGLNL